MKLTMEEADIRPGAWRKSLKGSDSNIGAMCILNPGEKVLPDEEQSSYDRNRRKTVSRRAVRIGLRWGLVSCPRNK